MTNRSLFSFLLSGAALIFAMVLLGGATRLTQAGLSIVEWQPIIGIIPPLSLEDWLTLFAKYQQTPEFQLVNRSISLPEFQFIFWMEYAHRVLGRVIGLWFLLPTVWWWRRLDTPWRRRLLIINLWIIAQGVVGWLMVKSGLVNEPHVSHYRLALHLLMAIGVYSYILWVAFPLRFTPLPYQRWWLHLGALVTLTIIWGAFVAGLKAGLIYNTFPDMNGTWLPDDAWFLQPWYTNFIANPTMVQFTHRVLAILTASIIIGTGVWLYNRKALHKWLWVMGAALGQATLGVMTLLYNVPVTLGVLHQAGALCMVTAMIVYMRVKDLKK